MAGYLTGTAIISPGIYVISARLAVPKSRIAGYLPGDTFLSDVETIHQARAAVQSASTAIHLECVAFQPVMAASPSPGNDDD
jgi:hypothetical protein